MIDSEWLARAIAGIGRIEPAVWVARIGKPWGNERLMESPFGWYIKLLNVEPGHRLSLQVHREKNETMMLLAGQADLNGRIMVPYNLYNIPAGTVHRLSVDESALAVATILEISSTGVGGDIIRLEDDYNRSAK